MDAKNRSTPREGKIVEIVHAKAALLPKWTIKAPADCSVFLSRQAYCHYTSATRTVNKLLDVENRLVSQWLAPSKP